MDPAPQRTTFLGGWLLAVAGLLTALPTMLAWIPAAELASDWSRSAPAQVVSALALLVACLVLAFGLPREQGIAGTSLAGQIAFVVLGLAYPVTILVNIIVFSGLHVSGIPAIATGTALALLPIAAVLVAAVAVVRAPVLRDVARGSLLVYALAQALVFALASIPNASTSFSSVLFFGVAAVPPLLLVATGISYVLSGRGDAVRRWVGSVYETWRLTTSVD